MIKTLPLTLALALAGTAATTLAAENKTPNPEPANGAKSEWWVGEKKIPTPETEAAEKIAQDAMAGRDSRLGWWRDARFGIFVHWGVYSTLAGEWQGKRYAGYSEHIQRMAKIPMKDYREQVVATFNPTDFDADAWVKAAKDAGMGYFIITAKHHDGFAMYDSKASDYNIVKATPFARDPMKELRDACKKHGIRFGFYYSHAFDWGDENGPGNDWDWDNPGGDKLLHGADWWWNYPEFLPKVRKYVDEKSIPQVLELIRNYQPDIMWFDTPHKLPPLETHRILAALRQAGPDIVVNSRILHRDNSKSDYKNTNDCPEEFSPQYGDWEAIPTTNDSFGYSKSDNSHKPPGHFIQMLAKAAARGGNVLMNIGPRGDGVIDPKDISILQGIGAWWKINGESIRGTTRTPLAVQAWGESTRKGRTLYLHVFDWPADGQLVVGGLKTKALSAHLLAQPDKKLPLSQKEMDVTITVPKTAPDADDSVVVLECAGDPEGDPARLLATNIPVNILRTFDAQLVGGLRFDDGRKNHTGLKQWKTTEGAAFWPVRVNEKTTFSARLIYDAPDEQKQNQLVEGVAGKEIAQKHKGAGGTYTVSIGPKTFTATVKNGNSVQETLGTVTLDPGTYEIRIAAENITGEELFRPINLELAPVKE